DLDIDALADLAAITGAGSEQLAGVLGGHRLDAPLLHTRDVHGRMEDLERGPLFQFQGGNSHGWLRTNHLDAPSLAGAADENKSATQTCHRGSRLHCTAGTG